MEEIKAGVAGNKRKSDDNIFNIKWFVSTILTIWPWILASVIVSLIIGNINLRYSTPIYKSVAELMINDSKKGGSSGSDDVLAALKMNSSKINVENEVEILRSRTLMTEVVRSLNLNYSYSIAGRFKNTVVYSRKPFEITIVDTIQSNFGCYVNIIDGTFYTITLNKKQFTKARWGDTIKVGAYNLVANKTADFTRTGLQYTVQVLPLLTTAKRFMHSVVINAPSRGTSCLFLSMSDAIPERAIDVINTLMRLYKLRNINGRTLIANRTMEFIDNRLGVVGAELTGVETDIVDFKQKNGIAADVGSQSNALLGAGTAALQNLQAEQVQLEMLNSVNDYLQKNENEQSIILPASLLSNPGLGGLMTSFNSLQMEIQTQLIVKTTDNPVLKNMISQKNQIKNNLLLALASTKRESQIKINALKQEIGSINEKVRSVPNVERLFLDYARMQQTKQDLYVFLLKKREETAIEKSSTVADAVVIDPAISDGFPISPNRSKTLTTSLIIGLLLPFSFILIRRGLNIKVISKGDIIKASSIPIVGEIGNNVTKESIAVERNSRTLISEQFRALRTNLQFMLTDQDKKTLIVTSSMSNEGKSFIAMNLAITFAMSGKKVVLLEFDLRKPRISRMLGIDNNNGYSNYIINKIPYEDMIVKSGIDDNLYILPSGPIPPNPAELILLKQTEELFARLRREFDYVIIDTSPVGLVTDAQLLYQYADMALYIVRQGHTNKGQLSIANDLYESGKMPKMAFIVNDVVANRGFAYGYGYEENYGYGGGYGYGYGYGATYGSGYYISDNKKSKPKKNK